MPPLKLPSDGSQAISPAAAMIGSPPVITGVAVLVGLGMGLAVKVGTDVTVGLTAGLRVAVAVASAGDVGEETLVAASVGVRPPFVAVGCTV